MKLTRNPTTEANPDLRGRKHHFIIENAPAAVLEAMDNMLTAAGWDNDTCPCYDDGFGCGWWIDIEEVGKFKAAYKEAKAGVKEFMAQPTAPAEFEIIIKGSVGIDNLFHPGDVVYCGSKLHMKATVTKLPKIGDVIPATDIMGEYDSRVKVREILNDCPPRPAHLEAARNAHHSELFSGFFNDRAKPTEARKRELEDMSDDQIYVAFAAVHAEAIEVNVAHDKATEAAVRRDISIATSNRDRAEAFQLTFRLSDEVTQRRTVEAAHAEALEENDLFDGIIRDGLTPEQRAIQTRREGMDIYGERFKAMLEADHAEALRMDEEITFVREFESLTAEQAMAYAQQWAYSNADAATKQKMFDRDHDEAFRIDAVRNCAIADNAKILAKPVEWRNRQFLWENTWSEEYLAFRLEAAHAEALLIAAGYQDVSAPLRIISDYMLRFMRNNKDAKLSEAKERLEKKIVQFTADGYDEQRLRQALSTATGSHTREALIGAFSG